MVNADTVPQSSTTPEASVRRFDSYHADIVRHLWPLDQFSPVQPVGPGVSWRWMRRFLSDIIFQELFRGKFRRGVNRCAGFAYNHIEYFLSISLIRSAMKISASRDAVPLPIEIICIVPAD